MDGGGTLVRADQPEPSTFKTTLSLYWSYAVLPYRNLAHTA